MRIEFKMLNTEYADYLRKFDKKVPVVHDGKANRPFIGCVISLSEYMYYIPLTSPKEKHKHMKNSQDFHKIGNGEYGAINFNNMIPVPEQYLIPVDCSICDTDDESTKKYKILLINQLNWCNIQNNKVLITKKANNLYKIIINNTADEKLKERCCNFSLLETVCSTYKK